MEIIMKTAREFISQVEKDCEELYAFHENSVKDFFASSPSKQEMIQYFTNRMINERINCTEISKRISKLPLDTTPEDMFVLTKQALDEAKHFRYVKEIVEDLKGGLVDVESAMQDSIAREIAGGDIRPATLLQRFEASEDPLTIALYQFIAEGMAARNWAMQAQCAPTDLIRSRYEEIAKDEKFHSNIGRHSLEKMLIDPEVQVRATKLTREIIELLWNIGCIAQHIPTAALEDLIDR
jgi:rubrerythrin